MNKPLRALIVEDCEPDTDLLLPSWRRLGTESPYERVQTAEARQPSWSGRSGMSC